MLANSYIAIYEYYILANCSMYTKHAPQESHTNWDGIFTCIQLYVLKYRWLLMFVTKGIHFLEHYPLGIYKEG